MTISKLQIELESFFLISIVAAGSLFLVIRNNQTQFSVGTVNSPLVTETIEEKTYSQISLNGENTVVMEVVSNKDNTYTYSFYTADGEGNDRKFVFEKTLDDGKNMIIPYNTWSSDNKYFFVQENSIGKSSIFAFKATGEPFSETEEHFDVTDLFGKKETGYTFDEATGWASESLIVINTKTENNEKGPSYWFEVPSKAVIQLSTKF